MENARQKTIIIFISLKGLGKSLLSDLLAESLRPTRTVRVFHEDETFMPVKDEDDRGKVFEYFSKLTDTIEDCPEEVVILDRFQERMDDIELFHPLEKRLLSHRTFLILLTIPENEIETRLRETKEFRGDGWKLNYDGADFPEEARKDAVIQKKYFDLFLPNTLIKNILVIDTLERKWNEYVAEIKNSVFSPQGEK
ncbi:MAG: hypothetical protein JWM20_931 [Patescibacteria group bacterium]|nr:hypothetical protein [Patescibacteria group bacterium]